MVIPKIDSGISYITRELDEMEREEFFRLKKIQQKKRERAIVDEQEAIARGKALQPAGEQPASMLDDFDEDIIF